MAEDAEKRVTDALERLARDVNGAVPAPGAELAARVLDDARDEAAESGFARLAAEVNAAAPRPDTDLMARVLADAATVMPVAATAPGIALAPVRPRSLGEMLFGWTGGAVAALSLCMTMGVAIGMELPDDRMPLMGQEVEMAEIGAADPMGILPEDFI